jgi:DNA-binding IscR family transcriptional regulator
MMEGALEKFLEHLDQYTLADILPDSVKVITLMQFDRIEL